MTAWACGANLTILGILFSHAADGAFTELGNSLHPVNVNVSVDTNLVDTALTDAPKDVVVVVPHGLCVVNGATPTIIK